MSKVNKKFIKAGVYYLIDTDKENFINRMSLFLQDKPGIIDYLFEGPLPITDETKQKIENYIKDAVPSPDYFKGLVDIEIIFNYDFVQIYKVTYKVTRFYDSTKQPWSGCPVADDTHVVPVVTVMTEVISQEHLKNYNNGKNSNFGS